MAVKKRDRPSDDKSSQEHKHIDPIAEHLKKTEGDRQVNMSSADGGKTVKIADLPIWEQDLNDVYVDPRPRANTKGEIKPQDGNAGFKFECRLSEHHGKWLDYIAAKDGRTRNGMIVHLINELIEEKMLEIASKNDGEEIVKG
ncbi:hypothetical protein PE36_00225 [Moritella sp. PE36]|uniref:hypothetical protein n=1 Tax=Moritella sp. PE36 TaxID=58051 RepID=UPI000156928E|nr:hypothetical protein [Moritella sp. PE36]EDM66176.1 hypothetical protein PE36_00225 [Moritella sp. PE36]